MVTVEKKTREILFFVLLFTLYFLTFRLRKYIGNIKINDNTPHPIIIDLLFSMCYVCIVIGIYFMVHLSGTENFWDVTPAAKCKGGPYFWQGDSPNSQMCREMAKNPEGAREIAGYNCPLGQVGQPGAQTFVYTPLSGDNWTNERTENCNQI